MRRLVTCAALPLLLSLASCESGPRARTADEARMFGPKSMRIHPTFTRVKDWTGDGRPDGIEAVVELQDDFGEPTRATGGVMFELYQYRATHPDERGRRIPEVWVWPLARRNEQAAHWSRALRAYTFKIPFDPGRVTVVMEATFDLGADHFPGRRAAAGRRVNPWPPHCRRSTPCPNCCGACAASCRPTSAPAAA